MQYGFVRFFRLKKPGMQYGFVRFFRLKKSPRQYGFVRFFRLKKSPRQYGFVRFFRLKKSPREFTQGSRHFCAFQQDMCSDESSTRVCLPSLCQASYNSLSFPAALYIHGDIYFVCAPPTETSTTNHFALSGTLYIIVLPYCVVHTRSTILPHTPKQSVLQSQN
jgi:hypothetical protein